jgi:mannose-1-phosphate guanylyltransferase
VPERIPVVSSRDRPALGQAVAAPENPLWNPAAAQYRCRRGLGSAGDQHRDPQLPQVVLPADHVIRPVVRLQASLQAGLEEARESRALVTFGIRPTRPATGFGYIELGDPLPSRGRESVFAVRRFVEKPDAQRAQQFLESGNFLWNAGIFAWRTDAIVAALERELPQVTQALSSLPRGDELEQAYQRLPSVSIDVAVLERERSVHTLPIDYFWSDVGTWNALADVLQPDVSDNRVSGHGAGDAGRAGNIVYGEAGQLVA